MRKRFWWWEARDRVAPWMEVEMKDVNMEVVNTFKFLGICFTVDRGAQQDMEKRVGEGVSTFGAVKMMFNVRSVSLGVKREVHGRVVVPTVTYGTETCGMRMDKKH